MTTNSKSIAGQGWDSTLTAKQSAWVERTHSPRLHAKGVFAIKDVVDRAIESGFIISDDGIKMQLAIANAVGNDVVIPPRFEIMLEARRTKDVVRHHVGVMENAGGWKDIIDFPPLEMAEPYTPWGQNFNK